MRGKGCGNIVKILTRLGKDFIGYCAEVDLAEILCEIFHKIRDARSKKGFFNYYNIIFKKNQAEIRQTTILEAPMEGDG